VLIGEMLNLITTEGITLGREFNNDQPAMSNQIADLVHGGKVIDSKVSMFEV
jgi:hypothetical protein